MEYQGNFLTLEATRSNFAIYGSFYIYFYDFFKKNYKSFI